ncbi:hypothetical protein PSP6_470043 [Paraburkholderia tropica]|nr:hypothetical protein PSP6_470043 [Paraburkholderia tropica]
MRFADILLRNGRLSVCVGERIGIPQRIESRASFDVSSSERHAEIIASRIIRIPIKWNKPD